MTTISRSVKNRLADEYAEYMGYIVLGNDIWETLAHKALVTRRFIGDEIVKLGFCVKDGSRWKLNFDRIKMFNGGAPKIDTQTINLFKGC